MAPLSAKFENHSSTNMAKLVELRTQTGETTIPSKASSKRTGRKKQKGVKVKVGTGLKAPLEVKWIVRTERPTMESLKRAVKPVRKHELRISLAKGTLDKEWLSTVLDIKKNQLTARISGSGNLSPAEGERVNLSKELMDRGTAAFGSKDVFLAWMRDRNIMLAGERPIDLMRSATGLALVLDELTSIEHGIPG
jgi:uncharacterized protein (DUF2384 family)